LNEETRHQSGASATLHNAFATGGNVGSRSQPRASKQGEDGVEQFWLLAWAQEQAEHDWRESVG
jgi:hypothetical protein